MLRNAVRAACFDGRLCSEITHLLGQTKRRRHRRQAPRPAVARAATWPRRGCRSLPGVEDCGDVDQHCTQVQAEIKGRIHPGRPFPRALRDGGDGEHDLKSTQPQRATRIMLSPRRPRSLTQPQRSRTAFSAMASRSS